MRNGSEIDSGGNKWWYLNNGFHREDGPAIEFADGTKSWYINNELHRIDGPAIVNTNGYKGWYINGVQIHCKDNEEFLRIVKLKAFW